MTLLKRVLIGLLVFILTILLFRGPIFRATVKYQKLPDSNRASFEVVNASFKNWIDENSESDAFTDINTIINHALNLTAQRLEFTVALAQTGPNKLYVSQLANCIGYASFFNTICNYLIRKQKLDKRYHAKQVVGKLELLSFDLHQISDNPFLKDHDFNVILEKQDAKRYFVDPSLYNYLKISRVELKSHGKNQDSY